MLYAYVNNILATNPVLREREDKKGVASEFGEVGRYQCGSHSSLPSLHNEGVWGGRELDTICPLLHPP